MTLQQHKPHHSLVTHWNASPCLKPQFNVNGSKIRRMFLRIFEPFIKILLWIYHTIAALIEIVCKMGITKSSFSRFSTAIFMKFRIFLIMLVKQIYMVALKVPGKWPQKMYFQIQNLPKIMQKWIARMSFSTGIVDIDPMKF